jgi:murein DD-endopeptidase MepM/ murein hydrolase activator NlpD
VYSHISHWNACASRGFEPRNVRAIVFFFLIAVASAAQAQPAYPVIHSLQTEDLIYAQVVDSIERFHQSENGGETPPELSFYAYTLPRGMDVFSLAAALSMPYDTLVTLNRLRNADPIPAGSTLLVPSLPGIFVDESPENDLEFLVKSLWAENQRPHSRVRAYVAGRYVDFDFYPGGEFHPSERSFFLVAGFRFPLPKGVLTSSFGARVDPFTGRSVTFHSGIDLGAPFGTEVYAARSGKVEATGWSDVYGNFIIVVHDKTWETLYGHLSRILVTKGLAVKAGATIGLVGSTGMSTGPHLHFEVRRRGVATNPAPLMMSR